MRLYGAQLSVPPVLMVPKHYPWLLQVTVTDTVHRTTIDTDNSKRSTHLIRRNKGQTGPNGSMWNGIFNRVHKPGVLYSKKVTQTPAPGTRNRLPARRGLESPLNNVEIPIQTKHYTLYIVLRFEPRSDRLPSSSTDGGWMKIFFFLQPECVHSQSPAPWTIYRIKMCVCARARARASGDMAVNTDCPLNYKLPMCGICKAALLLRSSDYHFYARYQQVWGGSVDVATRAHKHTHTQTKRCSFMTHAFCSLSHAPRGHYKAQFSHVALHGSPFWKCKYSMQGLRVQPTLQKPHTRRSAPIRSIIVLRDAPGFEWKVEGRVSSVQMKRGEQKCIKCLNARSSCSDRFFGNLFG